MKFAKLVAVASLFIVSRLSAQTEVKINPLGLLFGSPDVSAEFRLNDNMGLEPFIGYTSRKFAAGAVRISAVNAGGSFKYYFNPQKGFDRFYAGAYTRFNAGNAEETETGTQAGYTRVSLGFQIGQKWVSKQNVVFELAFGVGRAFVNNLEDPDGAITDFNFDLDLMGRFAVGYRFGGSSKK